MARHNRGAWCATRSAELRAVGARVGGDTAPQGLWQLAQGRDVNEAASLAELLRDPTTASLRVRWR